MSVAFGLQGSGQQVGRAVPDLGRLRELAQAAEELGYDSIWAGDHISYRNPILDIVVALATFAAATERITIGAGIVLLPLRHPSVVAKEFASLDRRRDRAVVVVDRAMEALAEGGALEVPLEHREDRLGRDRDQDVPADV